MNTKNSMLIGSLVVLFTYLPLSISAFENANGGDSSVKTEIAGWNEFVNTLDGLPSKLLERLPVGMRQDPQVQQEVGRLILAALASSTIQSVGGDGDHPVFLPTIGHLLNVGQPNADSIYRRAEITPGGIYRLSGNKGSLNIVTVSQSIKAKGTTPAPRVYDHDLNTVEADATGRFEVILSSERPKGYTGEWWELQAATSALFVRMVSSDWSHEEDPKVAIERLDIPVEKSRPAAADLESRLRRLPVAIEFLSGLFVDHVEKLRSAGFVNRLKILDVSQIGGLTGQFYYEGVYHLADDEALIVEAKVPDKCLYRSIILTNHLYETTDWYNNHSSLNGAQSEPDSDGVLRVIVSAVDPSVPNWLDTAGYPVGVVQGRWTGCNEQPIPSVTKVKVAEVRRLLPEETEIVTLEQRQEIIRARRGELQQRPQW